jgi:2-keto-4-pentenoate hydratase/2-oxohepta-3-ene-1,7-dioic acid hydratase in catechol pathway
MTWSLASYTARGGQGFGVLREDGVLVGPAGLERWASPLDLLEDWAAAQAVLRDLDVGHAPVIEYDTLLPPLRWPRKVICAGVNYRKHMREMGGEIPAAGWRPFFFL